jgi:flavin-dependent dehydrogenase
MTQKFDVAVLGGGPAGASTAISLLQKGYSVAIIEKNDYSEVRIGETIQPQILSLLSHLKIDDKIFHHHLPSNAIQSAWGETSLKENNFFFSPFGHGWHLNRLKFDKQLIKQAEKSGVILFINSPIKTITQHNSGNWSFIFLDHGHSKTIDTRFVIDATGRNAFFIKNQGGKRINIDHLIGVVSTQEKKTQQNSSNYTLVESVKNGWWYSADIPENKMVVAFMTDADLYNKENCNSEKFFNQSLSATKFTRKRCCGSFPDKIRMYAANSYIMTKTHGTNWIAIGDAAMAFDPLSSQGIYKAIKSGLNAAEAIHEQFTSNKNALQSYSNTLNAAFEKYMQLRKLYYLKEKRWPHSLFWTRRHTNVYSKVKVQGQRLI